MSSETARQGGVVHVPNEMLTNINKACALVSEPEIKTTLPYKAAARDGMALDHVLIQHWF